MSCRIETKSFRLSQDNSLGSVLLLS